MLPYLQYTTFLPAINEYFANVSPYNCYYGNYYSQYWNICKKKLSFFPIYDGFTEPPGGAATNCGCLNPSIPIERPERKFPSGLSTGMTPINRGRLPSQSIVGLAPHQGLGAGCLRTVRDGHRKIFPVCSAPQLPGRLQCRRTGWRGDPKAFRRRCRCRRGRRDHGDSRRRVRWRQGESMVSLIKPSAIKSAVLTQPPFPFLNSTIKRIRRAKMESPRLTRWPLTKTSLLLFRGKVPKICR